jgi:membrane associated rhomboid family serine protease
VITVLDRPLSITFLLIAINVAISLVGFWAIQREDYRDHFVFVPSKPKVTGTILSSFAHGDIGHLFFNMLALFFFGPQVEETIGAVFYAILYVVSGAGATLLIYALRRKNRRYAALGASGCIAGIMFAAVVVAPTSSVYLFFLPIAVPAPIFAVLYLVISSIHMGGRDGVSHEAHIGGAVTGFALTGLLYEEHFDPLVRAVRDLLP